LQTGLIKIPRSSHAKQTGGESRDVKQRKGRSALIFTLELDTK